MNRLRPRDGQTAKETQKNPPTSWPRPKPWACQCCQALWSYSFLLPLPPVSLHAIYPKPQRESPAHEYVCVGGRMGRGLAEVAVGERELKSTLVGQIPHLLNSPLCRSSCWEPRLGRGS